MKTTENPVTLHGETEFEGIHISQTPGIKKHFQKILPEFDRVIEIGTFNGGLTLFIHRNKKESCELISYDIDPSVNQAPKDLDIDFRIGNCMSVPVINEIKDLIMDESKRVLLLCDGGNKNEEFNLFSKFLKVKDVVMLHDFAESSGEFSRIASVIGWIYSYESSLSEISNSVSKYNLDKYWYDEGKEVLWGSFIKKGDIL